MKFADSERERLETFFERYCKDQLDHLADVYPDEKAFFIEYGLLERFDLELAEAMDDDPAGFLKFARTTLKNMNVDVSKQLDCEIRITNHFRKIPINDIRAEHLDKYFQIDGIVQKVTQTKPRSIVTAFECQKCKAITNIPQNMASLTSPSECSNTMCGKKGPFLIITEKSTIIDYQIIRVQELTDTLKGGQQPQSLDMLVTCELTGTVLPGEVVTCSGILWAITNKKSRDHEIEFAVNNITKEEGYDDLDITESDIEAIQTIAADPNIMGYLIKSVAPSIFNMDHVKEAIIYLLFAGVRKEISGTQVRGDIHILLVGDPGLAKSQLLKYAVSVAPRGVYTSGKSASGVGLTAAVVNDDFGGQGWSLEAGAMPLANNGVVGIDEFEKMSKEDRSSLHEAMEQQTVTIAKAGILATLMTRCAVLAAANPRDGRFNEFEPLPEQINMPPSLLSRFDLIYFLVDKAEPAHDAEMSGKLLNSYMTWQDPKTTRKAYIDSTFLRKYIGYARRFNPVLTPEAGAILEEYYLAQRKKSKPGGIPITIRQLEAISRIAESSARIRLSATVSADDARRACEITTISIQETVTDDEGFIDYGMLEVGKSASHRQLKADIRAIMTMLMKASDIGQAIEKDVYKVAREEGISKEDVTIILDELSKHGEIQRPKAKHIKLI